MKSNLRICDCGYVTNRKRKRCCHCKAVLAMPGSWTKVWRVVYHVTASPTLSFQMFVPGADELEAMSNFEKERPTGRAVDSLREMFPKSLQGEHWTLEEILNAKHVFSAICEGVDCSLSIDEMRKLEQRGLVKDIESKPGRGRYAGRYEFNFTDKLENLVREFLSERKG